MPESKPYRLSNMILNDEQRRYIRQWVGKRSPARIASDLRISRRLVDAELIALEEARRGSADVPLVGTSRVSDVLRWWLLAFLILVPLAVHNGIGNFAVLPKFMAVQLAACGFLFLMTVDVLKRGSLTVPKSSISTLILFLILLAVASLWWSANERRAWDQLALWCCCGLTYVAAFLYLHTDTWRLRVLVALFVVSISVSLLGLLQHILGIDLVRQFIAPAATFGNKNMAAQFIVTSLPSGWVLFLRTKPLWRAALIMVGEVIVLSYLFHTLSRAAWIGALASFFLFAVYVVPAIARGRLFRVSFPKGCLAVLGAGAFLVMMSVGPSGLESRGELLEERLRFLSQAAASVTSNSELAATGSVGVRLRIWKNTMAMIERFPVFGVGIGNWGVVYPAVARIVTSEDETTDESRIAYYAHCDPLQLVAELGVVGLFLAGLLAVRVVRETFSLWSRVGASTKALFAAGSFCALGGIAANSLFSFPFQLPAVPFVVAVFLGLLARLCADKKEEASQSSFAYFIPVPQGLGLVLAVIAGICCILWVSINLMRLGADKHNYQMMKAMAYKRWGDALESGRRSLSLDSDHWKSLFMMGQAYNELQRSSEALPLYRRFLAQYPNNAEALRNLGETSSRLRRWDEALDAYHRALVLKPRSPQLHRDIGLVYGRQGDNKTALLWFNRAAQLNDEVAEIQVSRGVAAFHTSHLDLAEEALRRALSLEPDTIKAWQGLLQITQKTGKASPFLEAFEEVLASESGKSESGWLEIVGHLAVDAGTDYAPVARRALEAATQRGNVA